METSTRVREFRFIFLVNDLASSRSFYEKIFNWPISDDWGGGVLYDTGAATFELIQDNQASKPNDATHISIAVADVHSLFERLKNEVPIVFPIRHNSWGDTSFRISDPDGFHITIFTPDNRKE